MWFLSHDSAQMIEKHHYQNGFLNHLIIFCGCTGQFVSDLVGDLNCWFSNVNAHLIHPENTCCGSFRPGPIQI